MQRELIVSVSGISNATLADLDDFRRALDTRGVPLSLFVAPRLKKGYRLDGDPTTADWIRRHHAAGDAVVLNGFDEAATKKMRAEFAALPAHEANLRLIAANRALEQVGLQTRLFAGPRWATSEGTERVLPRNGFRLLIGMSGTRDLVRGFTTRNRVIGIGAGFLSEPWWCRAVVLSAERAARRGETVRLAISARHLGRPGTRQAMLDAVDLAVMHGCRPAVYRWPGGPAVTGVA